LNTLLFLIPEAFTTFIFYFYLISGDLTDGKALDGMGSDQYIQEWELYKSVLEETNVTKTTVWLDIRGNHGTCVHSFMLPKL